MISDPPHRLKTEWITADAPVDYARAVSFMQDRVQAIRAGTAPECVWLLEHPPLYTAGTSARKEDMLNPRFPVFETGRGGQYTYHGPGQRVAYAMMDLKARGGDVRAYVQGLEGWIIAALEKLGVKGERREGRVGIWVDLKPYGRAGEAKIGALGVRVTQGVAWHGVSVNVNPDLSHYAGIVPCGISEHGVTSLEDLNIKASMQDLDAALRGSFGNFF